MDGRDADDAGAVGDSRLLRSSRHSQHVVQSALEVGFFFRKSLKIGPGLRLNLSKRGGGISAGPRGMKVSVNSRGERRGSLSFKGLNWRKRI